MKAKLITIIMFMSAALYVGAADYSSYVQLVVGDSSPESSFDNNSLGHWKKNGAIEPGGPHAGERYYTAGRVLCTSNATSTAENPIVQVFAGDELAVDGRLNITLKRSVNNAEDAVVDVPHMTALDGATIYNASANPAKVIGEVTVLATAADPLLCRNYCSGGRPKYGFTLIGDSTAGLYFNNEDSVSKSKTVFAYSGDATRYFGTIRLNGVWSTLSLVTPGGFSCPGTMELTDGAAFSVPAGSTATVGNLVSDGGMIDLGVDKASATYANLVVTNRVEANGKPIPVLFAFCSTDAEKIPIVTMSPGASGTLSADDFVLTNVTLNTGGTALDTIVDVAVTSLSVEIDTVTGAQTLYASHRKIVWHIAADANDAGSCLLPQNASRWSDGNAPSADADYYSFLNLAMYMPPQDHNFGGASLTICGSAILSMRVNSWTIGVPRLRFMSSWKDSVKRSQIWGTFAITGRLEVLDGNYPVRFEGWNNNTLTVGSSLCGSGDFMLSCNASAANDPRIIYALNGDNSAYFGRVLIVHDAFSGANKAKYDADPDTYGIRVNVAAEKNIGGPLQEFTADALTIGQHSVLNVTGAGTGVFDDPTRGWSIVGCGRIDVPADTTAVVTNKQITYSGEFRKEGEGRLVLGGTARFADVQPETPIEGSNILKVAAGSLMPASATACDGLAVTFAAGARLALDAATTGDLRACGLYNVKWDAPLTLANGVLPVEFAGEVAPGDRFGICTVNATAAQSLSAASFQVTCPKGLCAAVTRIDNADGSVTFACELFRPGALLIVR